MKKGRSTKEKNRKEKNNKQTNQKGMGFERAPCMLVTEVQKKKKKKKKKKKRGDTSLQQTEPCLHVLLKIRVPEVCSWSESFLKSQPFVPQSLCYFKPGSG